MATPRRQNDRRGFLKNAAAVGAAAVAGGWLTTTQRNDAQAQAKPSVVRPPGAVDEDAFLSRCIRCLRCGDACPNNAILPADASYGRGAQSTPFIQPRRQACMLCDSEPGEFLKCTEVCPSGALQPIRKNKEEIRQKVSMGTAWIDLALCYSYNDWSCGACYRACPFPGQAMTLGLWERPEINADACIGCGLCERACIRYPQAVRVHAGDREGQS
jgi:MauM/NapG family ferredoxin protein